MPDDRVTRAAVEFIAEYDEECDNPSTYVLRGDGSRLLAELRAAVLEEAAGVCRQKADCYASYAKQAYRTLADKVAFARDAETCDDLTNAIRALKVPR